MIVVPGSHLCNPTTGVSGWLAVPHGNQSHVSYPYSTFLLWDGGGLGMRLKHTIVVQSGTFESK